MNKCARSTRALTLSLILAASPLAAQTATTVNLSLDDARLIALEAAQSGRPEVALELAKGLLQADPDDRAALIALAAALPQLGRAEEGRRAGARAFTISQTDPERYEAARLTALAAANEGRFTLATWWLRRALTVAPSQAATNQTLEDAARLSRINPWSTDIRFSIVPSSNVNGGAETDGLSIDGIRIVTLDGDVFDVLAPLSADAQALSGIKVMFGFETRYRLYTDADQRLGIGFRYDGERVRLSDDALAAYPDQGRWAFGSDLLEIAADYDRRVGPGALNARLALGQVRSDGAAYFKFAEGELGYGQRISDAGLLRVTAQYEFQDFEAGENRDITRATARLSYVHRLENGDRLSVSLSYSDYASDNVNAAHTEWQVQGGWTPDRMFGPAQLSVSGGVAVSEYPDYRIGLFAPPDGRQDTSVFGNVSAAFPQAQYWGFIPVVSATATRSDSNISRFDRDTFSVGFDFRSAF